MTNNAVYYRLGILWPDGATTWGELSSSYDDAAVQGWTRTDRDNFLHAWRRQVRNCHLVPNEDDQPQLVVQQVEQTFRDYEVVN